MEYVLLRAVQIVVAVPAVDAYIRSITVVPLVAVQPEFEYWVEPKARRVSTPKLATYSAPPELLICLHATTPPPPPPAVLDFAQVRAREQVKPPAPRFIHCSQMGRHTVHPVANSLEVES